MLRSSRRALGHTGPPSLRFRNQKFISREETPKYEHDSLVVEGSCSISVKSWVTVTGGKKQKIGGNRTPSLEVSRMSEEDTVMPSTRDGETSNSSGPRYAP